MTVSHGGFLIPNAEGSFSTKMAEPDQIDFNILGNSKWGVVRGCEVSIQSASTVAVCAGGLAVVNGSLVNVTAAQSVTLGSGGSQPRFDLVGVDEFGVLKIIPGSPSADPVFPDVPTSVTVLAAVYCPVGSSNFSSTITDKRNMLQSVFASSLNATGPLLLNRDHSGVDTFKIDSNGRIEWTFGDLALYRNAVGSLRTSGSFTADGTLSVGTDASVGGDMTAVGVVRGSNFRNQSSFPTSAPKGTILQKDGDIYVQTSDTGVSWEQLVTAADNNQPGDIKQSLRSPSQMPGWLPLIGQTISESEYPQLFSVGGLQHLIVEGSPRVMVLPDASNRVLLSSNTSIGTSGGSSTVNIGITNLPSHSHNVSTTGAGAHSHSVTLGPAGRHSHSTLTSGNAGKHTHGVSDPGHTHRGPDFFGYNLPYIVSVIGANNRLDGPVNDTSHTYHVDQFPNTGRGTTGITVTDANSAHQHQTDEVADHTHAGSATSAEGNHTHNISESVVGGGQPLTISPPHLTVYTYIKT